MAKSSLPTKGAPSGARAAHMEQARAQSGYPTEMYIAPKGSPAADYYKHVPEARDALLKELATERWDPNIPTPDEVALMTAPPELLPATIDELRARYSHRKRERAEGINPLAGLELQQRHRYGSAEDILNTEFTKSVEYVDNERFQLICATRRLHATVLTVTRDCPKIEKYVLGLMMRSSAHKLLEWAVAIKKRYYRKNMLESMDIELDILREYFFAAYRSYPGWVTTNVIEHVYQDINEVGRIIGGLLKSTVV